MEGGATPGPCLRAWPQSPLLNVRQKSSGEKRRGLRRLMNGVHPSRRHWGLSSEPRSPREPTCTELFRFTRALTCAWRNATGLHRRTVGSGPVELRLPVRMLLNMVFITLNSVCPCNEVPREGVLSHGGRGRSSVFILGVLTHVTETIFLFKVAARMPWDESVVHLSDFQVCVRTSPLTSFYI